MAAAPSPPTRTAATRIDCDIHPALPSTKALLPYLDDHWREQVTQRAIDGMDLTSYPAGMPLTGRADWRPAKGKPGSDFGLLQKHALDDFGASHAICNVLYGAQAAYDPYMAAAFCRAINDWVAAEWMSKDSRLRASILLPMQAPDLAVEEIERLSGDKRFVQVMVLAQGEQLWGRRHFWPVWAAAEKYGLPLGIHAGSAYRQAPGWNGWPSYRLEYYLAEAQAMQAQVLSLVLEGVFTKFPRLKVVLMESGVSWLPALLWRASKTWKGVRMEVPWVDRPPADIVRDHVRLTLQPFDNPPDAASVEQLMEMIGSDRMLLYSSDYPHWHYEGTDVIPAGLSPAQVQRMCVDNPLETYPRLAQSNA